MNSLFFLLGYAYLFGSLYTNSDGLLIESVIPMLIPSHAQRPQSNFCGCLQALHQVDGMNSR